MARNVVRTPPWHRLAHLRRCSGTALQSPRLAYQAAVLANELQEDAHQRAAIEHLERLHQELLAWRPPPPPPPPPPPKESKWRGPMMDAYGEPIGGGTFYTGVKDKDDGESHLLVKAWGQLSKSWLGGGDDDEREREPELPTGVAAPRGVHLHEFVSEVHRRAHALRQQTPTMGDPLPYLAHEITCQTQVLMLDEVAVTDVADALMLRKLFRRLFVAGIVMVATSNRAPSELYLKGLQRDSFLPFIDDVERRCAVVAIGSRTDYRAQATASSGLARLGSAAA